MCLCRCAAPPLHLFFSLALPVCCCMLASWGNIAVPVFCYCLASCGNALDCSWVCQEVSAGAPWWAGLRGVLDVHLCKQSPLGAGSSLLLRLLLLLLLLVLSLNHLLVCIMLHGNSNTQGQTPYHILIILDSSKMRLERNDVRRVCTLRSGVATAAFSSCLGVA